MNPRYPVVAGRAEHRCEYCRAPEAVFNLLFEVEHVIPLSLEGREDDSNLALACRACNMFKSSYVTGRDDATQTEARLFHPRSDRWDEHFEIDQERGVIRGLTGVGRATVQRLQMNLPVSLFARLQWIRLGISP